MKTHVLCAAATIVVAALAPPALAGDGAGTGPNSEAVVRIKVGRLIYGAGGEAIAAVYRKAANGDPQVILDGRFVTVPAATITEADGKLVTSLSRIELVRRR
jgi:hypothetical protein